jgi:diazepam-binding inhibitor (GABA receptor modulator, acyl-CoA-binding protein)
MELDKDFEAAVIDSKKLTQKPANDVLLKLYSLYKQATEGDVATDAPTNPFDFVAKAKYSAWEELKGLSSSQAKLQYVELVKSLQ